MQLSSKGGVTLVGVASPAANVVELHDDGQQRDEDARAAQPGCEAWLRPSNSSPAATT